jgi:hypothetical protein
MGDVLIVKSEKGVTSRIPRQAAQLTKEERLSRVVTVQQVDQTKSLLVPIALVSLLLLGQVMQRSQERARQAQG